MANSPSLDGFWNENKDRIARALPQGPEALAEVLGPRALCLGFQQHLHVPYVHWTAPDDSLLVMFCAIPDPRDLNRILDAYIHTKERKPRVTTLFVHQWTDGEGSWDAFAIHPHRVMQHCDRICGSDVVQERGPSIRDDLYNLFACGRDFPEPGQPAWAELLTGPREKLFACLETLATQFSLRQTVAADVVHWRSSEGRIETQFFVLPDPKSLDAAIDNYQQIRKSQCPVSFVFVQSDQPRVHDIFRLSARSYLEHHNQVKAPLRRRATTGKKRPPGTGGVLEGLRWVPRWTSLLGCLQGCLDYLGIKVSDGWLFGATGHAFVLNIVPDLCASGPTDWDTRRCLSLCKNIGGTLETYEEYCPDQSDDLATAQQNAWDFVRDAIDRNLPCYGWELDIPEYHVIYGYDKTGYYISGPGCNEGKGPIPWTHPGRSQIGMILVSKVSQNETAADNHTVRDALAYALDIGHAPRSRRRAGDEPRTLQSYATWIRAMEKGQAYTFGLGYNTAVWAECRRYVGEFLKEAKDRLSSDLHPLFDHAIGHYQTVAENLKTVAEIYPFRPNAPDESVILDDRAQQTINALKQARDAEAAGLEVLSELSKSMDSGVA